MKTHFKPGAAADRCFGCGKQSADLVAYGVFDREKKRHIRQYFCRDGLTGNAECRAAAITNENMKNGEIEIDSRRNATRKQRREIHDRAGGRCEVLLDPNGKPALAGQPGERCENALTGRWVAGHFPILWAHGGPTTLENLRGECTACAPKVGGRENQIAKKTNRIKKHHETGRGTKRTGPPIKSRPFAKIKTYFPKVKRKIASRPFPNRRDL